MHPQSTTARDGMDTLFDEIERAVAQHLFQLALYGALALPDICGAMDARNGRASRPRYQAWFDHHVAPKYRHVVGNERTPTQFMTGEECYNLRCSMLHQGRTLQQTGTARYSRIIFLLNTNHCNVVYGMLLLQFAHFCQDMLDGARAWHAQAKGTVLYEQNYQHYLNRYETWPPLAAMGLDFGGPVIT